MILFEDLWIFSGDCLVETLGEKAWVQQAQARPCSSDESLSSNLVVEELDPGDDARLAVAQVALFLV